jgi:hypothetical protein
MLLETGLDTQGQEVCVSDRGSRGERLPAHMLSPEQGLGVLQAFANKAVRGGTALDPSRVNDTQTLHESILHGEIRDVLVRLGDAVKDERLLDNFVLEGAP